MSVSGVALLSAFIVSGAQVVWDGVTATSTSTEVAWLAAVCVAGTTVTGHKVDGEADVYRALLVPPYFFQLLRAAAFLQNGGCKEHTQQSH